MREYGETPWDLQHMFNIAEEWVQEQKLGTS